MLYICIRSDYREAAALVQSDWRLLPVACLWLGVCFALALVLTVAEQLMEGRP